MFAKEKLIQADQGCTAVAERVGCQRRAEARVAEKPFFVYYRVLNNYQYYFGASLL